jgi:hypothetical protein
MPTEERGRSDEEVDLAFTREYPTDRREQDPVDGPELRSAGRPLQHPELMAQDEDLEVLGPVVLALLATADEETDESAGDEVEERPHRPIVRVVRARIGVSDPHGRIRERAGSRSGRREIPRPRKEVLLALAAYRGPFGR